MLEKILISSKDPVRISLTIKGLAAFIPLILILTGFLGVNTVTELQLTNLVDSIADTVVADLSVISGIVTILGIVPKVHPEQARYRINHAPPYALASIHPLAVCSAPRSRLILSRDSDG